VRRPIQEVSQRTLDDILSAPAAARPALLAGRWLARPEDSTLTAIEPVSVLEGSAQALAALPAWLAQHAREFPAGGAIGYLAYELARAFESLALSKFDFLPEFSFAYYPRLDKLPRQDFSPRLPSARGFEAVQLNFDSDRYRRAITKVLDYLAAGDIYQANLTQQFSVGLGDGRPEDIFKQLAAGRSPFRAFLRTPAGTVISDSPERFFHVGSRRIVASPIKGTIARGRDAAEDERALARLRASSKDRAENTMIVDLLRNDLGRICQYQTIAAQLFEVEALPHLFHLVSHVQGTLRPEVGVLEIFRALFPCGSITGAPKIRAMEILAEIERVPRGVSMGAIGIILGAPGSAAWEMDFNVAIRTMMIHEDRAILNVGGGIVSDSQAEAEYAELMLKARPLLRALGVAVPPD